MLPNRIVARLSGGREPMAATPYPKEGRFEVARSCIVSTVGIASSAPPTSAIAARTPRRLRRKRSRSGAVQDPVGDEGGEA